MNPLRKKLDDLVSKTVRLRDALATTGEQDWVICISCGRVHSTARVDAGHYFRRGYSMARFHVFNVHAQCIPCNRYLKGNLKAYKAALIRKIGLANFKDMEAEHSKIRQMRTPDYEMWIDVWKGLYEDAKSKVATSFPKYEFDSARTVVMKREALEASQFNVSDFISDQF